VEEATSHIASCEACGRRLPGLIAGSSLERTPRESAQASANTLELERAGEDVPAVRRRSLKPRMAGVGGKLLPVGVLPPSWVRVFGLMRASVERVRARMPKERVPPRRATIQSRWSPSWVTGAVIGLLMLTMGGVLGTWFSTSQATPPVTMAVSVSLQEWEGLSDVVREQEGELGIRIVLQPIDPNILVPALEGRVAAGKEPWDLISVDNDTLGILVQKGLVQPLSDDELEKVVPPDPLFQDLQAKLRVGEWDYFVPFRPNVKLVYYNQDMLSKAGHPEPPTTWDELKAVAQDLHNLASAKSDSRGGRMAIQAHPGKAAAVTLFEWIESMEGDPLTLQGPKTREAFKRLWDLAPYLDPASTSIQFDTANQALINNEVSLVDNWTYGIKVVMKDLGKTEIKVTDRWPGSKRILGGDVLAIPTGVPPERKERAIKLIERLVAKETQRKLAERLYWAPVRKDVYDELPAREGQKEYFEIIRKALATAVMRPITPRWILVEKVLSDALQKVLEKGRAADRPANPDDIEALLQPYATQLQKIQKVARCPVVARALSPSDESCEPLTIGRSLEGLAPDFNTTPAMLAKLNGRGESALVSPENMQILLVPKPASGN
jgi:ABC-type glycerol-3-phosphate transport system substrate-binding protein